MYEGDPFTAKIEREAAAIAAAKKAEQEARYQARESEQPSLPGMPDGPTVSRVNRNVTRGWTKVPQIDMGKRTRVQIEELIRQHVVWNPHDASIIGSERRAIVKELIELGFRRSHVEEAISECKDREEVIEWLLIYVPEDDLPRWCLPENYSAGVSLASSDMKREAAIKRLADAGYSVELCERVIDESNGEEGEAAETLQNILLAKEIDGVTSSSNRLSELVIDTDTRNEVWDDEQVTLEAIFGSRYTKLTTTACQVSLEVPDSKYPYTLRMTKSRHYPDTAPLVSVFSRELPAYCRLSIIRQVVQHCNAELLQGPMVFNVVDWLEAEIPRILEDPGKLRDISGGTSPMGQTPVVKRERKEPFQRHRPRHIAWQPGSRQSMDILAAWEKKQSSPQQQKMMLVRQSLPAWNLRDAIVRTVNENQVTIISGETGSGKSTQSVQFVLDDMIQKKMGATVNIICTQPRRISALGLADRVSDERCSSVGEEVGYVIRGESKQRPGVTKITFVTTGVLLRRLQTSGGTSEDVVASLADVSHVVVDEVHERSLDTDFLLLLLRDILTKRKDLKVVLMSATLDANVLKRYFSPSATVGKIEIQGRTFPVEDYYIDDVLRMTGLSGGRENDGEDEEGDPENVPPRTIGGALQKIGTQINYKLIADAVRAIDRELGQSEGGILIFLPGVVEINRTLDAIRDIPGVHALPLHASLLSAEQRRVFPPAPKGRRKVIAATNVAETSITIEDIVAVIDTGKVKETSFDAHTNMVKLEEVWASRAACKQRRGRAGRVRAGKCYKLYTRNAESKMAERPEPEIRRVPLEQLCLSVRAMGFKDVPAFLASTLTPPETTAVDGALRLLVRMGALEGDDLTALGRHLSMIPADLRCGKLLVYGAIFGCLEACLSIAAILTVKSPFVSPQDKRDDAKAARASFALGEGDLIADLRAYETWSSASDNHKPHSWYRDNFLSLQTLRDISKTRDQYLSSLQESGFIPILPSRYHHEIPTSLNTHNTSIPLLRALIAASFTPQIARIELPDTKFTSSVSGSVALDPEAKTIKYFNQENGRVFVHPGSTVFNATGFKGGACFISFWTKMETSKVFVREITPFNAYTLLLFSSPPPAIDTLGRGLVVDNHYRLRGWARIGVLVRRLRAMLDEVLLRKIENPGAGGEEDSVGGRIVDLVRRLVEFDGMDR